MKILVVEDEKLKRDLVQAFLETRNIDMHFCSFVNPAVRYAIEHSNEISGIILDLGLKTYPDSNNYDPVRGLELIYDLAFEEIAIPILINSSTTIDISTIMANYSNVKGQTCMLYDGYKKLEWFINFLEKKKQ